MARRTPKAVCFKLLPSEVAVLDRPLVGMGGFQNFLRKLQGLVDRNTNTIELEDADLGRIIRHIAYKPGGFEARLSGTFWRSLHEIFS